MKKSARKAKGETGKRKNAAVKDLKPTKTGATRGGATNTTRFDPYKNFKF
jgi:hypothetical protein